MSTWLSQQLGQGRELGLSSSCELQLPEKNCHSALVEMQDPSHISPPGMGLLSHEISMLERSEGGRALRGTESGSRVTIPGNPKIFLLTY